MPRIYSTVFSHFSQTNLSKAVIVDNYSSLGEFFAGNLCVFWEKFQGFSSSVPLYLISPFLLSSQLLNTIKIIN